MAFQWLRCVLLPVSQSRRNSEWSTKIFGCQFQWLLLFLFAVGCFLTFVVVLQRSFVSSPELESISSFSLTLSLRGLSSSQTMRRLSHSGSFQNAHRSSLRLESHPILVWLHFSLWCQIVKQKWFAIDGYKTLSLPLELASTSLVIRQYLLKRLCQCQVPLGWLQLLGDARRFNS